MADLKQVLGASFDSSAVEPAADIGELLPAGQYTVEITDAEVKPTKAGTGSVLKLEHTIIDPEQFARRKVWKYLNLTNPNPQAEQIGRAELSALCRAAGIAVLADSDELLGKVVRARVTVRKGSGDYGDQNEVKGYESASVKAEAPASKPAPAAAKAAPPWAKKAA
jgi:hypothetical protein